MNKPKEAFPCVGCDPDYGHLNAEGMHLRDYFAAKALQGKMAAMDEQMFRAACSASDQQGVSYMSYIAVFSYYMADAMMEARDK